jgi:hypothetical protein
VGYCLSFRLNRARRVGTTGRAGPRSGIVANPFRGLDTCAYSSISVQKISWCEKHRPIPGLCIREPRTVASGKICCNNSCALGKMSALDDEVLPLSYGLNLSECGGNRYLTRLIKKFPFPPKAGLTGRVARAAKAGRTANTPLCTNERHHPSCGIRYCLREAPAT